VPIYVFETPAGEVVERFLWAREAPRLGETMDDPDSPGQTLTRLVSAMGRPVVKDYVHTASQLPRVHDPLKVAARREAEARVATTEAEREACLESAAEWRASKPIWDRVDARGKPQFTTKAQVKEFMARTGGRYAWDVD